MEDKDKKLRIGITMGDPNGISPEVILKCFQDRRMLEFCDSVIYGSPEVLAHYKELLNLKTADPEEINEPSDAVPGKINLIRTWDKGFTPEPGKASPQAGDYAFQALEKATEDIAQGGIDAMVTAPLNKHSVEKQDRFFPGHTEYLTRYANMDDSLMLLMSDGLRVGVVSGHVPLQKAPEEITEERILRKLEILENSLRQDLLIEKPLIAVLGLNPHAGESGMLGSEEGEIILPAIEKAREKGTYCFGPFAADGYFGSEELGKYDAVLAMYHDQGLAPFKALSFGRGVNFTAGLPIVRTSPDHGTAFGIAGKGEASPSSFRNAIYAAIDLQTNRQRYKAMNADPLRPQKGSPYMKEGNG